MMMAVEGLMDKFASIFIPGSKTQIGIRAWANIAWETVKPIEKTVAEIAIAFFLVLIFFELMREALDLAMGKGFNLDKKLISYTLVVIFFVSYPTISKSIWSATGHIMGPNLTKFEDSKKKLMDQYLKGSEIGLLLGAGAGMVGLNMSNPLAKVGGAAALAVMGPEGMKLGIHKLIIFIADKVLDITLLYGFIHYAIVLVLGPFFVLMFFSNEFKKTAMHWLANVVGGFILFPILGICLSLSNAFLESSYKMMANAHTVVGIPSIEVLFDTLRGPLMSIALVLMAYKLVHTLFGASSSGHEAMQPYSQAASVGKKGLGFIGSSMIGK
jgi:hypothetical protein